MHSERYVMASTKLSGSEALLPDYSILLRKRLGARQFKLKAFGAHMASDINVPAMSLS